MHTLVITPGDPEGIGPEITWKAIQAHHASGDPTRLVCVGARAPFEKLGIPVVPLADLDRVSERPNTPTLFLIEAPRSAIPGPFFRRRRGKFNLPGYQSGWSIVRATEIVRSGRANALVTGPISKERLQAGGYAFPGHTEFLAALCKSRKEIPEVTMMLANSQLRVSLVTTHLALKDVPRAITRKALFRAIMQTLTYLRRDCRIQAPRIAIAGLNPHAGEAGLFGREEQRTIAPGVRAFCRSKKALAGASVTGPLPADTLFAKHILGDRYDAIVCMYHDQGLIPVKLLDFPRTVNVSLGLPIVRTSVDHGVAFDIAGTGKADPSSLIAALGLAAQIVKNRQPPA